MSLPDSNITLGLVRGAPVNNWIIKEVAIPVILGGTSRYFLPEDAVLLAHGTAEGKDHEKHATTVRLFAAMFAVCVCVCL